MRLFYKHKHLISRHGKPGLMWFAMRCGRRHPLPFNFLLLKLCYLQVFYNFLCSRAIVHYKSMEWRSGLLAASVQWSADADPPLSGPVRESRVCLILWMSGDGQTRGPRLTAALFGVEPFTAAGLQWSRSYSSWALCIFRFFILLLWKWKVKRETAITPNISVTNTIRTTVAEKECINFRTSATQVSLLCEKFLFPVQEDKDSGKSLCILALICCTGEEPFSALLVSLSLMAGVAIPVAPSQPLVLPVGRGIESQMYKFKIRKRQIWFQNETQSGREAICPFGGVETQSNCIKKDK